MLNIWLENPSIEFAANNLKLDTPGHKVTMAPVELQNPPTPTCDKGDGTPYETPKHENVSLNAEVNARSNRKDINHGQIGEGVRNYNIRRTFKLTYFLRNMSGKLSKPPEKVELETQDHAIISMKEEENAKQVCLDRY